MRRLTLLVLAILAFPAAAAAQEPVAPVVTTEPPRDVSHNAATFVATVEPGSSAVRVGFAYGRPGEFNLVSETREVAAGSGRTEVAIAVTDLSPSTSYEVRTVAEDADHFAFGEVRAFQTVAAPRAPTVSLGEASTSSARTATLRGNVRGHGQATRYRFEYGPTTALGSATPEQDLDGSSNVRASVQNLPPASTIYYQLVARSAGGETRSEVRSFATAAVAEAIGLGLMTPVVAYGTPLVVSGRVTALGDLTGKPVGVEVQYNGSWRLTGAGSVDGAGAWWARLGPVQAPLALRAYVGDRQDRVHSAVVTPQVRPIARLAVKRAKRKGPLFTVTVRPVLAGMTVSLERRTRGGRWTRVARKSASGPAPEGAFRFRARRGAGRYRALVVPHSAGWVAATTPERAGSLGR